MKQNILNIFISAIICAVIIFAGIFVALNLMTLKDISGLKITGGKLGTTLTTITEDTLVSDLGTILPANFNALNDGKIEVSTTTLPLITTLLNLTSVGTIGTGIWRGTALEVGYGGTGTTSPTSNLVILGNGAAGFKTVSGFGTTGQFLTSNGAASAPTWTSNTLDTSLNFNWTGYNRFNGLTTFAGNASSTGTFTFTGEVTQATTTFTGQIGACTGGFGYIVSGSITTQNISHGLGVVPSFIEINATSDAGGSGNIAHSWGMATSTTGQVSTYSSFYTNANLVHGQSTSTIIQLRDHADTLEAVASVSYIGSTYFTLNWTTNANIAKTRFYQWKTCR